MDGLSIIGLLLGLVALIGGSIAKGSGIAALWNFAAFMIVVIGTLAATMVNSRPAAFFHAMRIFLWVFRPPAFDAKRMIKRILNWSAISRRDGLLALESEAERERDPFLRKALQLLVDGTDPQSLRQVLESDVQHAETFDIQAARVFESMGIYSPTLGIIGAVMGLMAVMQNLSDPSRLGHGIAAAFVATIYGIGFANLLFLPAANKLKSVVHARTHFQSMMLEGLVAIGEGENTRTIEMRLSGYLSG